MSLANYTDLKASMADWLDRTDLTTQIVDFIRMAEARMNRLLRVRQMQATLAETALVSGAMTLPTGFLEFEELRAVTADPYTLQPKTIEWIRNKPADTGDPIYFAVTGTEVVCWPTGGSITGSYYQEIPALSANATNWLLTSHPDIYLFAALEEAAIFTQDDARMRLWASKAAGLMEHLQSDNQRATFGGGVLSVRAR